MRVAFRRQGTIGSQAMVTARIRAEDYFFRGSFMRFRGICMRVIKVRLLASLCALSY